MSRKAKSTPLKPRRRVITLDLGRSALVKAVGSNAAGEVEVLGPLGKHPIQSARVQTTYREARSSKPPKSLNEARFVRGPVLHDLRLALRKFTGLVAVDTNTRPIAGEMVSVTAIIMARRSSIYGKQGQRRIHPLPPVCYEFRGATSSAEEIGWLFAIDQPEFSDLHNRQGAIALIVDSSLSDHDAYNDRTKLIANARPLPPAFQMIYASSDASGKIGLANRMIRVADRQAKRALRAIEAGLDDPSPLLPALNGAPYSLYRKLTPLVAAG